jgi:hypothetical protein
MKDSLGYAVVLLLIISMLEFYFFVMPNIEKYMAKGLNDIKYSFSKNRDSRTAWEIEDSSKTAEFNDRRDLLIDSFKRKYQVVKEWDSISYPYSIMFDTILKSTYQLIGGQVTDIYIRDSAYFCTLKADECSDQANYFFTFEITPEQSEYLVNEKIREHKIEDTSTFNIDNGPYENKFIVKLDKFKKMQFPLKSNLEEDNIDNEKYAVIGDSDVEAYWGSGKVVEIIRLR